MEKEVPRWRDWHDSSRGRRIGEAQNPGPFTVYWVRVRKSGKFKDTEREGIGYTEKVPEDRLHEHLKKMPTAGTWISGCEILAYRVLYETESERDALVVELLATLWRVYRVPPMLTEDHFSGQKPGQGGKARGGPLLLPKLTDDAVELLRKLKPMMFELRQEHRSALEPLMQPNPAQSSFTAEVRALSEALLEVCVGEGAWADLVRAHLEGRCFHCGCKGHFARQCPQRKPEQKAGAAPKVGSKYKSWAEERAAAKEFWKGISKVGQKKIEAEKKIAARNNKKKKNPSNAGRQSGQQYRKLRKETDKHLTEEHYRKLKRGKKGGGQKNHQAKKVEAQKTPKARAKGKKRKEKARKKETDAQKTERRAKDADRWAIAHELELIADEEQRLARQQRDAERYAKRAPGDAAGSTAKKQKKDGEGA